MVLMEDYQLNYDIYLAESELFQNIITLGYSVKHENVSLISINEGFKETIINYQKKIAQGIQKAWDKFKELLGKASDYLKGIVDKIANAKPQFTINNFISTNIETLKNIKVPPFNYQEMKDHLDSKEAFLNKYFPDIQSSKGDNLSEKIRNKVITGRSDTKATPDLMKKIFDFCRNVRDHSKTVQDDIELVNNEQGNISNVMNTISSTTESVLLFEYYLLEAPNSPITPANSAVNNNDNNKENNKMEFKDDPGAVQQNQSSIAKKISVYLGVAAEIISAKMKCIREIFNDYLRVLQHYIKPSKEKDNNNNDATTNVQSDNANQVKV